MIQWNIMLKRSIILNIKFSLKIMYINMSYLRENFQNLFLINI